MAEEFFGPGMGIQKVANDDEAMDLMQDADHRLTTAVFSPDQARAEKMLSKIEAGTVYWICCIRVSPNVSWSGQYNSGLGSTLSNIGIRAFVQPKSCHLME